MAKELVTIRSVCSVRDAQELLETEHAGFPIINIAGNLCGIMSRSVLIRVIYNKGFYKATNVEIKNKLEDHKATIINSL